MNKFVLVACLATCAHLAFARPDVSLGYHYHPAPGSGGDGSLQTPGISTGAYFNAAPAFGPYVSGGGGAGGGALGFGGSYGSSGTSSYNAQFVSGTNTQSNYLDQVNFAQQAPIVTKHFYLHTAPDDHDEQQIVRYINIGQPQKNYRVVFINTPSSSVGKAKIIANVAPVEDKTAIYVLAKKSNALDVSAEVVTQAPVDHKPEVFFVKYRTPEEAVHAQHTIQAQYDALGGSSDFVNEGTIPVTSAIGSLGDAGSGNAGGIGAITVANAGDNTQQTYLPAHHK